jgi:hypothetical protein
VPPAHGEDEVGDVGHSIIDGKLDHEIALGVVCDAARYLSRCHVGALARAFEWHVKPDPGAIFARKHNLANMVQRKVTDRESRADTNRFD